MKAKHNKRLMMFENVIRAMDTHFKTWSHVAELSRTYDQFVKRYKNLSDLKLEEDIDLRPHVERYMEKRKELGRKLIPMVSAISVFAGDTGDKKLKKQTDLTATEISKMKDRALSELTHRLVRVGSAQWKKETDNKKGKKKAEKNLTDYGLTVSMMEELEKVHGDMITAKKALRDAEKHREQCAGDIVRISKSNNKLLNKRLDRLVGVFQVSDPEFYKNYMVARGLMKPGKTDSKGKKSSGKSTGKDTTSESAAKDTTGKSTGKEVISESTGKPVTTKPAGAASTRKTATKPTGTASKRKTTTKTSGTAGKTKNASKSVAPKKTMGKSTTPKTATGKATAVKKTEVKNVSAKKDTGN